MIKAFLILFCSLPLITCGQTSETSEILRNALEKHPQADTNKDGILTRNEAIAYRNEAKEVQKKKRAAMPKSAETHIYKTVNDVKLSLYLFKPEDHEAQDQRPAIVFFHGGGWKGGSPSAFIPQCEHLAGRGMVAITVEYRVSSRHDVTPADCVEDAKTAMRWVRANANKLGINPNRIASGGGSAGGHLAACTALIADYNATDDPKISAAPNAMVLFNPALALAPHEGLSDIANAHLAARSKGSKVSPKKISPLSHVKKKQAPCLILFGTDDRLLEGAEVFEHYSQEAGNTCELVTYEGAGHGFFNSGKFRELTMKEMDQFLVDLGWLK